MNGKAYTKIDGNRRITIYMENDLYVWAIFTDMQCHEMEKRLQLFSFGQNLKIRMKNPAPISLFPSYPYWLCCSWLHVVRKRQIRLGDLLYPDCLNPIPGPDS